MSPHDRHIKAQTSRIYTMQYAYHICNGLDPTIISISLFWAFHMSHKNLRWGVHMIIGNCSCADPGIFVRGVQVSLTKKKSSDNVFLVLSLIYRSQLVNFKKSIFFSRFQRGSNIFQGGGPTFSGGGGGGGGPIAYSYRNPYNL